MLNSGQITGNQGKEGEIKERGKPFIKAKTTQE